MCLRVRTSFRDATTRSHFHSAVHSPSKCEREIYALISVRCFVCLCHLRARARLHYAANEFGASLFVFWCKLVSKEGRRWGESKWTFVLDSVWCKTQFGDCIQPVDTAKLQNHQLEHFVLSLVKCKLLSNHVCFCGVINEDCYNHPMWN